VRIVDFQALVPKLLDGEHTGASIDTAATAIGVERARTLAQARSLAGDANGNLTLNDAVFNAMIKRVDEQAGDQLRSGHEVKWGRVLHLQKDVLLELQVETDPDTAFQRVLQERQTKAIVEQVVGRKVEQNEIVNGSNGGKVFKITTQ
jgi:hypothetical protein